MCVNWSRIIRASTGCRQQGLFELSDSRTETVGHSTGIGGQFAVSISLMLQRH